MPEGRCCGATSAWGLRAPRGAGGCGRPSNGVLDAQTGLQLYARPGGAAATPEPGGRGDARLFAWWRARLARGSAQLLALDVRTGLRSGARRWAGWSAPLYTARGGVLLPTQGEAAGLVELAADGHRLQDRRLCERQGLGPDWALHAGCVSAPAHEAGLGIPRYDLPERVDAAARGWTAEAGSPARTGAPR